jgi:hypothetical protein
LIIQPAITYLHPPANHNTPHPNPTPDPAARLPPRMRALFEAAHSAVLAVFACPANAPLAAALAPFYAETLLAAFPAHISPRQFRLAFRTVMQILSPPFPVSASHPLLAETMLEMVRYRAVASGAAGTAVLPPVEPASSSSGGGGGGSQDANTNADGPVSEQSTLVLTLVDALPFLDGGILEEWLALTAATVHEIRDAGLREVVQRRFWDVLGSGEMDVERAALALAWWGTKGGREAVLFGARGHVPPPPPPPPRDQDRDVYVMSGAIVEDAAPASKL